MRKIFLLLGIVLSVFISTAVVNAATIDQALNGKKPFCMLVYTDWGNGAGIQSAMKTLAPRFKNYNFVKVNLGEEEAASLFRDKRFIVTEVPMVVLAKSGGRLNRVIAPSCASDTSCLAKELKRFGK